MDEVGFRGLLAELESEGGLVGRHHELPPQLLTLHRRILRHFADTGSPPPARALQASAVQLGVGLRDALAQLVRVDLIQADPDGLHVVGAYPFASAPRGHRVDIAGGPTVEAYCAADALGISAMLERAVTITSRDPQSGVEVRVEVRGGEAMSEPAEAVVSIPTAPGGGGQAGDCCCPAVNFYASAASARTYEQVHGLSLDVLTVPQALQYGSAVFKSLLKPPVDDPSRRGSGSS